MKWFTVEVKRDNRVSVIRLEAKDAQEAELRAHEHIGLRVKVKED